MCESIRIVSSLLRPLKSGDGKIPFFSTEASQHENETHRIRHAGLCAALVKAFLAFQAAALSVGAVKVGRRGSVARWLLLCSALNLSPGGQFT